MNDYLIVEVRVPIPLPENNVATWPDERCQRVAEETAGGIAADYPGAQLARWWVGS